MNIDKKTEHHVIFDTETTGLPHDRDARAIAYALLVVRDEDMEPVYQDRGFIRPTVWSPHASRAEAIHKIPKWTIDEKGHEEAEVAEYFRAIDAKYNSPQWTSYNRSFDIEMLSRLGFTPRRQGRCIMELSAEMMHLKKRTVALRVAYPALCANIKDAPAWAESKAHDAGYDTVCAYYILLASRGDTWHLPF